MAQCNVAGDDWESETLDPEKHLSMREHLQEAVHWLHDHVDKQHVIVLIVVASLLILGLTHITVCIHFWNLCTAYFSRLGIFATVPITLICIFSTVVGFPVDFALVWSGAFFEGIYGLFTGTTIAIVSCCVGVYLGCIAAFLLGKTLLKPKVEKHMEEFAMLRNINAIIESDGWKFALIMRFSPLIPNEPLNYACAMTSMSLKHMAISTLGSLPKTAYEVWLAAQAASSLSSRGSSGGLSWSFIIILNICILLLMVVLSIAAKKKYDDFVNRTRAIPFHHKKTMRRSITLKGFDAKLKRTNTSSQPLLGA